MKASYLTAFGQPDVLQYGDLPTPTPRPGEVLVKVGAAALNPVDTYLRAGIVSMNVPLPFIPGCDLAGTVEAIGPGVAQFQVGDRVWGSNQGLLGRQGTFAEYACASEDYLYPTPANVSDEHAAAMALVGITAWLGLVWRANLQPGETVLVSGGTGGVGHMVVQIAKALGATAIATCSKLEVATRLGADHAIHYSDANLAEIIKQHTNNRGVDVWYETQPPSDLERTFACMSPGGRAIIMAGRQAKPLWPNGAFYTKNLSLFGFAMFNVEPAIQRRAADDMNRWMTEGKLHALIGARFPLAEAAAAHRLQEENTTGKKSTLTGKIVLVP